MNDSTHAPDPEADVGTPVSVRIRERIRQAHERFHANDDIAKHRQPEQYRMIAERAGAIPPD